MQTFLAVLTFLGYVLTLESRERVVSYDYTDTKYDSDRFPAYSRMVQAADNPALVVFNPQHEPNPIDARLARVRALAALSVADGQIAFGETK